MERHPAFAALFTAGREVIQTMSAADLRKAIEEPANRLGVGFEPGLVDELMSRVQGEPAGLPLLSFTLLKLWEMHGDGPMKTAMRRRSGTRRGITFSRRRRSPPT